MDDQHVFVVFRVTGDHFDEYLGVAADLSGAKRLCMADQKKNLEGWQSLAQWRAGNTRANELTPVIDLRWYEDGDGDVRTSDDSTFVYSYNHGYHIVRDTLTDQS